LLQLLPEIYHYGLQGESAQNIAEHIQANRGNIDGWISAIQNTTTK